MADNRRTEAFHLVNSRMQWRLIIPNLAIELVAVQTKRDLGDFKTFVRANLNRSAKRDQPLKSTEKQKRNEDRGH